MNPRRPCSLTVPAQKTLSISEEVAGLLKRSVDEHFFGEMKRWQRTDLPSKFAP